MNSDKEARLALYCNRSPERLRAVARLGPSRGKTLLAQDDKASKAC